MAVMDTDSVLKMYKEFAQEYDATVLHEYEYTAYEVIPRNLISKIIKGK